MVLNATVVDETVTVAVGIAKVSARAAAAGPASLPRPSTEGSFPWIWHGWLILSTVAGVNIGSPAQAQRLDVDSKAMRKFKEDEVMVLVFEVCESTDQTGTVQIDGGLRVLSGD